MKRIPSKNYLYFALFGALSLSSFFLSGCQPARPLQVEPTHTTEDDSTGTPTIVARASPTPPFTEESTLSPTSTSPACFHLISPGNGTSLSGASTIRFRWEAQPGAQLYILTVIFPDQRRSDVRTKNTTASVTLKNTSKPTTYKWYVNAFGSNGNQICNSTVFSFTKKRGAPHADAETPIAPPAPQATPTLP